MNWITAIIGGVGTVGGLFNQPDPNNEILNQAIIAQREADKKKKINNTIAIIVTSVLIIGTGVGLYMYAKKNK